MSRMCATLRAASSALASSSARHAEQSLAFILAWPSSPRAWSSALSDLAFARHAVATTRTIATTAAAIDAESTAAGKTKATAEKKVKGASVRLVADAGAPSAAKTSPTSHARDTKESDADVQSIMDMRNPGELYPLARTMRREITLHVGPTNSGKTYAAMQRLKRAASGVYCAPLRLLAWEISESMNRDGVACTLTTGQEQRVVPFATHNSCTVEMADTNKVIECAVIDEIQIISDSSRGYAYTRALLGLPALELHLCGDPRVVPLVKKILSTTGDVLVVKEYERLAPLQVAEETVSNLRRDTRKGDCFVAFSRSAVYRLKSDLEKHSVHRACVIYGGLPPEARSRQAELFNKEDSGYDVLIASDAIGMGLNLNIKRVIFTTMSKYDGVQMRPLESAEVKQIAGRAGRYGLGYADMGQVTTQKKSDRELLLRALEEKPEPLTVAGIAPTFEQIEQYCLKRANSGLVGALMALTTSARLAKHYKMRDMEEIIAVAKIVQQLPLALEDQWLFSIAPVDVRDPMVVSALSTFARNFSMDGRVGIRIISLPPARTPTGSEELAKLESAHKCLDLYLWLARRFPEAFPEEELAQAYRSMTATAISAGLQRLSMLSTRPSLHEMNQTSPDEKREVLDVMPQHAVRAALDVIKQATKAIEDERERIGLPRLSAAERKASSIMMWRYQRDRWNSPAAESETPKSVKEATPKAPLARVTKSKLAVKGAAAQEAAAIEDVDAAGASGGVAESTEPTRVAESKARARRTTSKAPVAAPVAAEILDESPRKDEPIAVTQQTSPIGAH